LKGIVCDSVDKDGLFKRRTSEIRETRFSLIKALTLKMYFIAILLRALLTNEIALQLLPFHSFAGCCFFEFPPLISSPSFPAL
jgi:hypothetical protein